MKRLNIFTSGTTALFVLSVAAFAQTQIVELKFKEPLTPAKTLQSLVVVRDISEQYATGGLYLMTHEGDFDSLFENENRKAVESPMINESWRYCSMFSTRSDSSVLMGRNWDNQNVGSIIVSLYKPSAGYSSISFTRAIDMGFPLNVRLDEMASTPLGDRLLLAPFYSYDGMNDQGVCASLTGISHVRVEPVKGKEGIFVSFLVRKILDHAKSVGEAVNLAEKYVPFDLDKNSLDCHFFVVDATGRSVVLEYREDGWKAIYSEKPRQVMTNKVVYDVPDSTLRSECWRYKSISETLDKTNGKIDWQGAMQILRDVSQKGTTWSVVYSPTSKDIWFSVYQSWNKIYHLHGF